jgi:hypothetical protein
VSFAWGLDFKVNSIQDQTGTLTGIYMGALLNKSIIVALTGALNVGHPEVNYGYFGLLVQYTHNPHDLLHFSGQLVLGTGTTKDYEREKSSTFDNFGNITGPGFWLIEPGIIGELNLSTKVRLGFGLGYRLIAGLDENDELISKTEVTNKDLSGVNFLLSCKIATY